MRRFKKMDDTYIPVIGKLIKQGLTHADMAERAGFSPKTIASFIARHRLREKAEARS